MIDAVADRAFGSLRQRVERHLLDLDIGQNDRRLIAPVTQQGLAEAVGSARPAVAKVVAVFNLALAWTTACSRTRQSPVVPASFVMGT